MPQDVQPPFNVANRRAVMLRFGEAANRLLRKHTSQRGDVAIKVHQALTSVDLATIAVEPRDRRPGSGRSLVYPTSVTFDPKVHKALTLAATKRGVPVVSLVEAAILAHFAEA